MQPRHDMKVILHKTDQDSLPRCLGITEERDQVLVDSFTIAFEEWEKTEDKKYSKLLEMLSGFCRNPNEFAYVISCIFRYIGEETAKREIEQGGMIVSVLRIVPPEEDPEIKRMTEEN